MASFEIVRDTKILPFQDFVKSIFWDFTQLQKEYGKKMPTYWNSVIWALADNYGILDKVIWGKGGSHLWIKDNASNWEIQITFED